MEVLSVVNIFLIFLGVSFVILVPSLRKSGAVSFEEGLAYAVLGLGVVPLALGTERAWCFVCPTLFERFLLQLGATTCFLLAFGLQLRANARKPEEDVTRESGDPFESNPRSSLWNDDEEW